MLNGYSAQLARRKSPEAAEKTTATIVSCLEGHNFVQQVGYLLPGSGAMKPEPLRFHQLVEINVPRRRINTGVVEIQTTRLLHRMQEHLMEPIPGTPIPGSA